MERSETGFTLTELLVVLVIMPLIIGAIAAVVVTGLLDQNNVASRSADSTSAELTSAYFVRDVQSASFVTTNQNSTPAPCGAPFSGGTFLLGLSWGAGPNTATSSSISYSTDTTGDLVRSSCTSTGTATVNVATGLQTATASVTPAAAATAAAVGWHPAAGTPVIVGITLSVLTAATNYGFNLVGVPRIVSSQNQGVDAGTPTTPALLLNGSSSPSLTCSAGTVNVNGDASINGTASLTNGAQFNYTPPLDTTASAPDPFSGLNPPTSSSPGSPSGSLPTITYSPGVYPSGLVVPNNAQATLDSGLYIIHGDLAVSGDSTLTSAPGGVLIYVDQGGTISVSGTAELTLSAWTSPLSPDAGILTIWQDVGDTNPIEFSSSSTSVIGGAVYAPGAELQGGDGANFTISQLVAQSMQCSSNGLATIG